MLKKFWLVGFLLVILSACQFQGVNVERNADGSLNANVTLSEADVNTILQNALAASANPLLRNPSVDLQTGQIVVSGTHDKRDGSGSVNGTVTLTASVNNSAVSVQVTSLNIEGLTASDATVQELNNRLSATLGQRGLGNNQRAKLTGIAISNDTMTFTLTVQPK